MSLQTQTIVLIEPAFVVPAIRIARLVFIRVTFVLAIGDLAVEAHVLQPHYNLYA